MSLLEGKNHRGFSQTKAASLLRELLKESQKFGRSKIKQEVVSSRWRSQIAVPDSTPSRGRGSCRNFGVPNPSSGVVDLHRTCSGRYRSSSCIPNQ
jgi:hypothetical protein